MINFTHYFACCTKNPGREWRGRTVIGKVPIAERQLLCIPLAIRGELGDHQGSIWPQLQRSVFVVQFVKEKLMTMSVWDLFWIIIHLILMIKLKTTEITQFYYYRQRFLVNGSGGHKRSGSAILRDVWGWAANNSNNRSMKTEMTLCDGISGRRTIFIGSVNRTSLFISPYIPP